MDWRCWREGRECGEERKTIHPHIPSPLVPILVMAHFLTSAEPPPRFAGHNTTVPFSKTKAGIHCGKPGSLRRSMVRSCCFRSLRAEMRNGSQWKDWLHPSAFWGHVATPFLFFVVVPHALCSLYRPHSLHLWKVCKRPQLKKKRRPQLHSFGGHLSFIQGARKKWVSLSQKAKGLIPD